MTLAKLHFYLGVAGLLVFLLTGQYMDHFHQHLEGMADRPRMFYRSAHIYLMLAFALNLFIGVYFRWAKKNYVRYLQMIISVMVIVAPILYVLGFFLEFEFSLQGFMRPYSRWGSYFIFIAGILVMVQVFFEKEEP